MYQGCPELVGRRWLKEGGQCQGRSKELTWHTLDKLDSAVGFRRLFFFLKQRRIRYRISSLKAEKAALGRGSSMSTSYFEPGMRGGIQLPTDISAARMFTLVSLQSLEKIISVAQLT